MVQAHPDEACEPRLRLASTLADQMQAALIGIAAETYAPPPEALPWAYEGGPVDDAVDNQIEAELRQAETRFKRLCGGVRKGAEWRALKGSPRAVLAVQSRAADLVVCGAGGAEPGFIERNAAPGDLLMMTGRPVLTGPADADRLDWGRIVVAWKDCREARRAMSDAMPFLSRADRVLVVTAPERHPDQDPAIALADVAEAIRRHGGNAAARILGSGGDAADAVLEAAVEFDAGLIVAGGYGHSRLSEWAFGGVTRRLLDQNAKFVLMSH